MSGERTEIECSSSIDGLKLGTSLEADDAGEIVVLCGFDLDVVGVDLAGGNGDALQGFLEVAICS